MATALPPPFVDVPGTANFRDIGDGSTIRTGLVFRSADPSKATEAGLEKMSRDLGMVCSYQALINVCNSIRPNRYVTGIKFIFDLRSTPEIQRDGPEWTGVEVDKADSFAKHGMTREWTPVFAAKDYGPEQVALRYKHYTRNGSEGFVKAYLDILHAAPEAYTRIFKHLEQTDPSPCLVHCTAGKDRTGVLVALLKMLVGVDREKIAQEYALTDQGLEHLKPLFTERLLKNPALAGNEEGVKNMTSSKKENMEATIDMIEKEFGGAQEYMSKNCGLSAEEIESLRRNLKA